MEISFLAQDGLFQLKSNPSTYLKHYRNDSNEWITKELGYNPFIIYKTEVTEFQLNPEADEVDNAQILYTAMKNISDSDATDERLWAGLTHGILWQFMRDNLEYTIDTNQRVRMDDNLILNRYFFNTERNAKKRSMFINNLSKLWWAGRLTFDSEDRQSPFKSIELFRSAFSHKLVNTFSSSFMANENARFALFDAGLFIKEEGIEIKGDTLVPLTKYLNMLGGSMILDMFSREELRDMLINYAKDNLDEIKRR